MKPLLNHLRYTFIGNNDILHMIIAKNLTGVQDERLVCVLCDHKTKLDRPWLTLKELSLPLIYIIYFWKRTQSQ
jgi:hypothetical protein